MASKLQPNQSQSNTTTALAPIEARAQTIHGMLGQRANELAALLGGKAQSDAFRRAAISFYLHAPADAKLETVEPRSFVAACMDAAADKLVPDGRDGWIVVRKGQAAWTISWRGLVKLARRASKSFRDFAAEVVYRQEIAQGGFEVDLASRSIKHRPWYTLGIAEEPDENDIALVYAIVTVTDDEGFSSREFATISDRELMKRARASGNPYDDMPSQAWAKWFTSMSKKAAVRLLCDRIAAPDAVWDAIGREDARVVDATEATPRLAAAPSFASELAGHVRSQIAAGDDTPPRGQPSDPNDPAPHGVVGTEGEG